MNYQTKMKLRRWNRKPFIAYGLLGITGLMYLLQEALGGSTNQFVLVQLGAKVNELIVMGEWWRLFTPMFLHIGITHLLFNGLVLYFLGIQLEMVFGHWRFFLLYVLSALAGNAASFALNQSISAGASTALFGLFGSTLVLGKLYPTNPQIGAMARNFSLLIVLNLVFGLLSPGIDMAGHVGGLIGGYLLAYALSTPNTYNNNKKNQLKYALLYVGVVLVFLIIGYARFA
ncbi:GlpG protein (membrane protein of glp regulon) [Alkalibacterium sp. AK22]|uniref:rhomboid family intramembrane serine protease n=1 Tax=Alkalibacterium sp. AK22 TaxID=1229520 RepID=UPI00044B33FE|nr:rhomboid family intramembrane serine protease [Alkalibacterium sp. AK22]EXJ22452.1 GlpG protein (membrane protein of glp regulon) [Alkalibacterium sp. AK22]